MASERGGRRHNLLTLFLLAAHGMTDDLVARLAAAGFSEVRPAHGRVFENLDPRGTRLSDLAARAQMTHQSMSELVRALEAAGYVERRPDPTDGRAKLVCLTPLGRRLLKVAVREIAEIEAAWFGRLRRVTGPEELRAALQEVIRGHMLPVGSDDGPPDNDAAGGPRSGRRARASR